MATYLGFLRAINLGPTRKFPKDAIVAATEAAGFEAAKIGAPCEAVDAAARKVITDAGFGPDYKVPGLPHRTGHGIGMDGHEWTNFVRGNKTPLAAGMCFSNEPTVVIYGEFGIRLEDCLYMTDAGPKYFSEPSPAMMRMGRSNRCCQAPRGRKNVL